MAGIKLTMSVDKENVSFQEEVVDGGLASHVLVSKKQYRIYEPCK